MKVLVTGHHGYIGSVLAAVIADAGHEVTGVDTFFYEGCDFVRRPRPASPRSAPTSAIWTWRPVGLRRDRPPRGALERSSRGAERGADARHQLSRDRGARAQGEGGGRRALRVRLVLQHVRRRRRRRARDRGSAAAAADGVRGVEGARRGSAGGVGRRGFRPGVHAQRDRLRRLASPALRRRAQQSRRLGLHDRARANPERRHPMAPARPRPRHRRRVTRDARSSRRPRPGVAFNVGANSENHQVRDLATIVHDTFPGCTIEYAEDAGPDPRSYRVDFGKLARAFPDFATRWTAADGARELRDAFGQVGLTRTPSRETSTRVWRG